MKPWLGRRGCDAEAWRESHGSPIRSTGGIEGLAPRDSPRGTRTEGLGKGRRGIRVSTVTSVITEARTTAGKDWAAVVARHGARRAEGRMEPLGALRLTSRC